MPPTPATPVTDWGAALMTSLTAALALFLAAVPRVVGFLLILLIGWIVAAALARVVAAVLRRARFDHVAARSGFTGFAQALGMTTDASGVVADIVRWFVRLIVLVVAFDELGLPAVSNILNQFVLWLPNLVVALVILMLAGLAANFVHRVVRGATQESGFGNADLIAGVARIAVWAFAVIVAVNQVGIATTLVDTLFVGLVAALALAFGLAFGLGGRDTAGTIVRDWHARSRAAGPQVEEATRQARGQAETPGPAANPPRPAMEPSRAA